MLFPLTVTCTNNTDCASLPFRKYCIQHLFFKYCSFLNGTYLIG